MTKTVITRFAPSPTGFLHIGGARTALFNWLYAKNKGGKFLLRIEDTDLARSTNEATSAIYRGLEWLKLEWDGKAISQAKNFERHQEIANHLINKGLAYRCYATQQEIADYQQIAKVKGISTVYKSPWRDVNSQSFGKRNSVIRLKSPDTGVIQVYDKAKGRVTWKNNTLDDLVLLRQDQTPTYMLAVVVDDHDMNVSLVMRGDDHLTNTARQILIYNAMEWEIPDFAHLPLINGPDGSKLSKRHGAVGVSEYERMGYPAEALNNYLTRLGWSHGDEEYFTEKQAIEWFTLENIGKSPARFDKKKLDNISKQHIMGMSPEKLIKNIKSFSTSQKKVVIPEKHELTFKNNIEILRERSKTYSDIYDNAQFFVMERPIVIDEIDGELLTALSLKMLQRLTLKLSDANWNLFNLEEILSTFVSDEETKFQLVAQPLRVALLGKKSSPNIAEIMNILGREETLNRLSDVF
jgi:glutamyl-tRNA synthetase